MSVLSMFLFGVVVLITHYLEGITGFGCTVLALPFCIMLVGIKNAVPTLIILAWILALYIIIIDFKSIVWKEFIRILTYVGIGLPFGILIFNRLPEALLKNILAVFMILVSARGLYVAFKETSKEVPLNKWILNFFLFLGGIIHGAFGTGGPFVVIYAAKALPKKNNFRATLCVLWFSLNSIIIVKNITASVITPSILKLLGFTIPFLIVGMILGNLSHDKVDDKLFTKIVYAVLLVSGFFMFI